jgi:hypothetical protein
VAGTLVGLIILFGTWLRVVDLGEANFHGDELDLVYAAESLAQGDPPLLPSGSLYERALDFTRVVKLSITSLGTSEATARLPAAAFGAASLVLITVLAWVTAGPWAAVWACLLLAVYPEALKESRRTRFYSYQLFYVLLGLIFGWYVLRDALSGKRSPDRGLKADLTWKWLALGGLALAFLLATRVQLTTLSVVTAWIVCCGLIGISDLRTLGRRAWKTSVPLQLATLAVAAGVAVIIARPGLIQSLWRESQHVPLWAGSEPGSVKAYYWHLLDVYPVLSFIAPVAFLFVAARNRVLALFLFVWFAVPLGLHTFVFAWKGPRFIIAAMPAMLIALAILAASICGALYRAVKRTGRLEAHARLRVVTASLAVAVFAAGITLSSRSFRRSVEIPPSYQPLDWVAAQGIMDSLRIGLSVPKGTSMSLPALYYWREVDFTVGTDSVATLEPWPGDSISGSDPAPIHRESYGGLPILAEPEQIWEAYAPTDTIVIAVDIGKWQDDNIAAALKTALEEEAVEMCRGRCLDLRLYVWSRPVEADSSRLGG